MSSSSNCTSFPCKRKVEGEVVGSNIRNAIEISNFIFRAPFFFFGGGVGGVGRNGALTFTCFIFFF